MTINNCTPTCLPIKNWRVSKNRNIYFDFTISHCISTDLMLYKCFLLLPPWISRYASPINLKQCVSVLVIKKLHFALHSPEWRIPALSTCSNLSNSFCTDTLQQTTAQQPDFQLYKLVNSSHNKPANVIWGNVDQPNAHPSSLNLQLGGHMLLWQYWLPTNKACSREIFFFPPSVFLSNLPVLLVCQRFSIWLLGVSWVRGWMHASLAQAQQRLGFLGKVSETYVKEGFTGKIWCEIDVKVMRQWKKSWYAIKMICWLKLCWRIDILLCLLPRRFIHYVERQTFWRVDKETINFFI